MNVSRWGSALPKSSSVGRQHKLSPTVNEARTTPRLVHMATCAESKDTDVGDCGTSAISSALEHRPTLPPVTMAKTVQPFGHETTQVNSNSKSSKTGDISGGLNVFGSPTQEGSHALSMGPNRMSTQPVKGYRPTPSLARLFARTGMTHRSSKLIH
jgi:hypothetical protein